MALSTRTPFVESDVQMLVEAIWSTVLSLQARRARSGRDLRLDDAGPVITGCAQITGAWEGAVLLECSVALAHRAAAAVFRTDPAELSVADLEGAIGELTNMHGGNLKGLLPDSCFLSLPAVVHGRDHRLRVPGAAEVCRQVYECDGERFVVSILGRTAHGA